MIEAVTMKRKATDQLPRAADKKHLLETNQPFVQQDDDLELSEDDESQSGRQTVSTPLTTNTSLSRKFPSDLKTIPCSYPECTKTFNRPARLAAHLRSHRNDRAFKCPNCDKTYLEQKHLRQHIKGSHTQERKYTCDRCQKSFLTATRLRRHAAVHQGEDRFRCRGYENCDKSFRKHSTLARHIRTSHLGQKAYTCGNDGCQSSFDTSGALRRHIEREHGELKFWCEECNEPEEGEGEGEGEGQDDHDEPVRRAGFTTMALLEAHMRNEHINCLFCDVKCRGSYAMERHVEMYHSGKTIEDRKTVACTWENCTKTFTKRSNLNVHIRTVHEGVRFICGQADLGAVKDLAGWDGSDACGSSFVTKMKLEEHVRYVHLKLERPAAATAKLTEAPTPDLVNLLSGVVREPKKQPAPLPSMFPAGASNSNSNNSEADLLLFSQEDDTDIDATLAGQHFAAAFNELDAAASQNGPVFDPQTFGPELTADEFWIGASDDYDRDDVTAAAVGSSPQEEWRFDEAEMRRLIGDDDADGLAGRLDPSLFL